MKSPNLHLKISFDYLTDLDYLILPCLPFVALTCLVLHYHTLPLLTLCCHTLRFYVAYLTLYYHTLPYVNLPYHMLLL